MKISCHSCAAKYTVSDDKVQGKAVKIKCRKCGATIVVDPSGAVSGDAPSTASAVTVDAGSESYSVNVGENDQRTMSLAEIVTAYNAGVVQAETYVWAEGMTDWQPLKDVPAIVSALHAGSAAEPEPAPAPAPAAEPARAPRAAAPKADLFGAAPAATAPTGTMVSAGSGGAGREENSVLFSLGALTARAPAPAPSIARSANREDSGLIDLKALAASAAPKKEAPVATAIAPVGTLPLDAGVFPLGAPVLAPPPAPVPAAAAPAPKPSNNNGLFIGGGLAIGLTAIAAVFFFAKGEPPAPPATKPAATETAAPAATPTQTTQTTQSAAPTAATTADPVPSASASSSASSALAVAPVAGGKAPTGKQSAKGTTTAAAPTTKPEAKPAETGKPKVTNKCGCQPGDIDCIISCKR
jgi:predicted Zn finger-like uncharacterized protein